MYHHLKSVQMIVQELVISLRRYGQEMVNYAGQVFRMPGEKVGTVICEKVEQFTSTAVVRDGDTIKVGDTLTLLN